MIDNRNNEAGGKPMSKNVKRRVKDEGREMRDEGQKKYVGTGPRVCPRKRQRFLFSHILRFTLYIMLLCLCSMPFYAQAEIVLKAVAINPSPDIEKEVELKASLPKEVRPEHIISSGDLEVRFDPQQSVYYVYKIFTLPPKGTVMREVEIEDIWTINEEQEVKPLMEESEELWAVCRNSQFADQAGFLRNNIDSKINQITQSQRTPPLTPQEHISTYRKNLDRLQEIRADLESLNQITTRIKPISAMAIWRLILFIVGFLAIIATAFTLFWFRYLKAPTLEKLESKEEGEGEEEL